MCSVKDENCVYVLWAYFPYLCRIVLVYFMRIIYDLRLFKIRWTFVDIILLFWTLTYFDLRRWIFKTCHATTTSCSSFKSFKIIFWALEFNALFRKHISDTNALRRKKCSLPNQNKQQQKRVSIRRISTKCFVAVIVTWSDLSCTMYILIWLKDVLVFSAYRYSDKF